MNEQNTLCRSTDSAQSDWRDTMFPAASQQARDELADECKQPGKVRNDYVTYCAEMEVLMSPRQYVAALERMNDWAFVDRVESILRDFAQCGDAA